MNEKMRILLCNPADTRSPVEVKNPLYSIGMLCIASYLRKHIDEPLDFKYIHHNYEAQFSQYKPDLVLMTTVSARYNISKWIAKQYKELDRSVPIIVGGHHITALPQTMTNDMDIAVLREGEETMCELLPFIDSPHKDIKGIAYREGDKLKITEPRPLIKNIDSIPFPARDIVKHKIKRGENTGQITARGCPYQCIFCSNRKFWGNVRFHSPEYVVREIKEISENYTNKIMILDDTFTINKKRLRKIADLLQEESLDLELNVAGRADTINEEVCDILKKMGVDSIMFGLESGNQKTLDYLKNGRVKVEDNYRAIKLCKERDIDVYGSLVIGSPDETREDILDTLKLAKSSYIWISAAFILTPLPDTPLWDEALKRGLVSNDDNMDWDKLNYSRYDLGNSEKLIVMSNHLSRKELFQIWKKFERYKYTRLIKAGLKDPMRGITYAWQRICRDVTELFS